MLFRRGSIVVPTAPYIPHHPWQVEWKKGVEILCFIGIIGDKVAVAREEYEPKRFPEKIAMSMSVTTHGMNQRSIGQNRIRMRSKPFATGAKSGSAVILKRPDFGRTTVENGEYIDEDKGYASWSESELIGTTKPDSVYLVLHSASNVWFLSWVNEEDVQFDDIKIAVIKKMTGRGIRDWSLLQLWKSDVSVPSNNTQFEVTWAHDDAFQIKGGYCTFNQHWCKLDVEGGSVSGTTEYIPYYPDGAINHGMIKIEKPAVWYKSIPAYGNAPEEEEPNPNLDEHLFVCSKTKSEHWSVIVGHPVPSENAPCMFIVPRDFAHDNLMIDIWKPSYGILAQTSEDIARTGSIPYGEDVNGPTGSVATIPEYALGGDNTTGYYLEFGERPLAPHYHEIDGVQSFYGNEAYWTTVAFRGVVVAHIDWNTNDSKWEVKQYHSGNITIPNSDAHFSYVIKISASAFATWFTTSLNNLQDYFWTTSLRSSRNDDTLNSSAELMWQDCNHIGNASISSTLIKY